MALYDMVFTENGFTDIGIIDSILSQDEIKALWVKWNTEDEETWDIDCFIETYVQPVDPSAKRVFLVTITAD